MASPHKSEKKSRSDLLSLLSQACEFEHALACSYLYTSFSLKQEINEGIDWRQQQLVRRWAADIFAVAAEEMLHFAQVWNIMAAIGGNPYYWRPNFPIRSNYYPAPLPITLSPFREDIITRFVLYESPDEETGKESCKELGIDPKKERPPYSSVAQLYTVIHEIIKTIPEDTLFIGNKEGQIDKSLVDFPKLIKVSDRDSALAAITLIKDQGEGFEESKEESALEAVDIDRDGHWGLFRRVKQEFCDEKARAEQAGETFEPVRDVLENPVTKDRTDYGVTLIGSPNEEPSDPSILVGRLIQDEYTREVSDLFDRVYLLMMRLLQYVFRNPTSDMDALRGFAWTAIGIMPTIIKPLSEALTLLPAGEPWGSKTAGPAFGLSRHVTLPENPRTAMIVVKERLTELLDLAQRLAEDERAPAQLVNAHKNLGDWFRRLP